jgi:membrane-associated phospholipid phosphatase
MSKDHPNWQRFLLPVVLLLAGVAAFAVDVPIARAFRDWNLLPSIHSYLGLFDRFEVFGHGMGVAVLLIVLHQLDPKHRWAIPRLIACAAGAGMAANLVKMLIFRTRPYGSTLDGTVWSTFGQWFSALGVGSVGQSFPSAHTATAIGFAAGLTWLYPQGRLLFFVLTVLVGCQRIVCGAHYLSDVLIGAAVGCLAAQFVLKIGLLPRWFDQWELRWKAK